jgi:hypothetical protein
LISPFAIANGRLGRGKFLAAAFWTWRRYFRRHWMCKTFSVAAGDMVETRERAGD